MNPLVSVTIPTFNRAKVIGETLESVLAQTYSPIEIIVVDDGSTDDTEAVVAPYLDRIRYIRQPNGGLAVARNTGFAAGTGELVAWLDSDDTWNPEKLAIQMAFLQRHPEVVGIASDFSAFGEGGFFQESYVSTYYSVVRRTAGGLGGLFPHRETLDLAELKAQNPGLPDRVEVFHGDVYEALIGGNCLHPPTFLFRRSAAVAVGQQDPVFGQGVDYEYLLRLSRVGPLAFVDRPLMRYRCSDDQMSSDKHLTDMMLSRLLILDRLKQGDPALMGNAKFRNRLGTSHLAAAVALAETERPAALMHLLKSFRWGTVGGPTLRAVAKLLLPHWATNAYRRHAQSRAR